jgi:hypothetical protein
MIRRLLPALLVFALLAGACAEELGRGIPSCDDPRNVEGAHIIQAQAVQTADLVPCIAELPPLWTYEHVRAQSDLSRFWLATERVDSRFLEVRLTQRCELGDAELVPTDEPGTELWINVVEPITVQPLIVVPDTEAQLLYAQGLVVEATGATVRGKQLRITVDDRLELATDARVAEAHAAGIPAAITSAQDVAQKTVELRLPAGEPVPGLTPGRLGTLVEDWTDEIRYEGSWYYLFTGGCTEYRFDVKGEESLTVAEDVARSLGFFDMVEARTIVDGIEDLIQDQ